MITSHSVKLTLETNSVHTTDQPTVLLIGTSNIKFIKEDELTPFAKVIKQIGYTLDETYQFISSSELTSPDLVLFHPFTNDVKRYDPKQCRQNEPHYQSCATQVASKQNYYILSNTQSRRIPSPYQWSNP